MEWRLKNSPPPPPLAMAALLGDCIQNFRVSLEYAAWAAASEQARQSKPTQIEFPLQDTEDGFRAWSGRRTDWFSEDVWKVLEWAQPYHAAADQLHPLRILRVLSNTDKHRLLNVVDHAHIDVALDIDPTPPTHEWWTARGPVADGELLARLSFPRPPRGLTIDVRPSFGWYESVAYAPPAEPVRWLRLDEMMNAVCDFTVRTVGYMSNARQGPDDDSGHAPTASST